MRCYMTLFGHETPLVPASGDADYIVNGTNESLG